MGAAAAVELTKPKDASDIAEMRDLEFARSEIIRLRSELGHLASAYGMNSSMIMDASDLVKGVDEDEDFHRCVAEISHIRQCLQLNTLSTQRQQRNRSYYQRNASRSQFIPVNDGGAYRTGCEAKYNGERNRPDSKQRDSEEEHDSDDTADTNSET
jgi:uncharacterized protein YigA (DUF484 family)